MEPCKTCPGAEACASKNILPLLDHAFHLHKQGLSKMEILFAVDDDLEALVEKYTRNISSTCWSNAAAMSLARILAEAEQETDASGRELEGFLLDRLRSAVAAFRNFPFAVHELDHISPDIFEMIEERMGDDSLENRISQRAFRKLCAQVAFEG